MLNAKNTAVVAAAQALMLRHAHTQASYTSAYGDLALDTAAVRAHPNDGQIRDFIDSAENLLNELDRNCQSSSPEWQALADAVDAALADESVEDTGSEAAPIRIAA
jgi:hypothetical protein